MTPPPDSAANLFRYLLPGGWLVIAGKTDADNDILSARISRPNDFWFHIRGMPGSHVVLRVTRGADPDRETLRKAAGIAAYHSKARKGGIVAVSCTRARNVNKPRGSKTGSVQIRKEDILKVRPGLDDAIPLEKAHDLW
jgi:predicted ribosome quality control (RQC) complex YloA/Tae2 family protein